MQSLINTSVSARGRLLARAGRALAPAAPSLLESLEPRQMLSTYTVANLADTGAGSLRQAILDANAHTGADVVEFQNGLTGTITLGGTELQVTDDVAINGPGAKLLTISGNDASRVFNFQSGTSTLGGLTITLGRATSGGGIFNYATLTITNSTISNSTATNFGGGLAGGIYNNAGTLTINNSTISRNSADALGGGIYNDAGTLSVTNSSISENSTIAYGGGGIHSNAGVLSVNSSTIAGNSSRGGGGGGVFLDLSGTLTITNSTISGNRSQNGYLGGGIVVSAGTATIKSTIVAGNAAIIGLQPIPNDIYGSLAAGSTNNLIGDAASAGGLTNGVNANLVGVDPLLGALANNGGPTQTMALLAGSPAIGKGINPTNLTTDQRGGLFARGTAVDIGAYQRQTLNLVVDTLSDAVDGNYSAGNLSLREAIGAAGPNPGNDTITFAAALNGGTIALGGTELAVAGDVTISGPGANLLTVSGNNTSRVFNFQSGTSTLSGLTVTGAHTTGYGGGGICNAGTLTITNSTISNNTWSFGPGGVGGIYNTGALTVTNSTISGNSATSNPSFAGGILNETGTLTIRNSTISGNSSSGSGGGAIFNQANGTLTISNSTISGNTSSFSVGGIRNVTGTVTVVSSIVAGNTGGDVDGTFAPGSTNNLIGDAASSGGLTNGVNGNLVGVDPKLGALASNGGPTKTMALAADSPAIGKGINPTNLTTDQRGGLFARGTAVDIGAYQRQTLSLVVDTLSDVVDGNYGAGNLSLREAIGAAGPNPGNDTITFAAGLNGGTITLGGTELAVTGDVTITGPGANLLTVSGNNASRVFTFVSGTSTLSGITVTGGHSDDFDHQGGGIRNSGTLNLLNVSITGNFQGNYGANGGGLFNNAGATLTLTGSTVSGNGATYGGAGLANFGVANVTNSTFTGNTAGYAASAIVNSGTLLLWNSTVANNTSGYSAGISTGGATQLVSSIIAGNNCASPAGPYDVVGTLLPGSTNNLIQDAVNAGGLANGVNGNLVGVDPKLGALASNGGPTQTMALLAGSPAINKGINPGNFTTDQRGTGFARTRGAGIDIGAYEFSARPTIASLTASASSILRGQVLTLTANTVADADGTISAVNFYRDANNNGVADAGELIGSDTSSADGYSYAYSVPINLSTGSTAFLAVAVDNDGGPSIPRTTSVLIQPGSQNFVVSTIADDDDGDYSDGHLSLREAIKLANANPGADSITFAASLKGGTITLDAANQRELTITDNVTITGPGASALTIDGGGLVANFGRPPVGVPYAFNFTAGTSTLSGLLITGAIGWGINNSGTLTISQTAVVGNRSKSYKETRIEAAEGGGIRNSGTMLLLNSTVAGNSGGIGGGILNSGTLTISNSTIANNSALAEGPIQSDGTSGWTSIGGLGGGLLIRGGTVTLVSSIFVGNTTQPGTYSPPDYSDRTGGLHPNVSPSDVVGGTLAPGSTNNLIQNSASAGGLTNGVNGNIVGVDPGLLSLGAGVFIPRAGSPAIDKGINPNNLTTDLRGAARVKGGGIDIGAVESGNAFSTSEFIELYTSTPKSTVGLIDGDWIADILKANVANVVTSDAYWGARNLWFQDQAGDVWSLWQGGSVHDSKTLPGQHEWVLTNLTDAGGLSGSMHLAPGSLSGVTTGWNAFSIQGIQDGQAWALWWSPQGSAGDYIDTDGSTKHGQGLGLKGNGWSFNSITAETTLIGGAITTHPAAFLAFSTSQANGRTEFDPRSTFVTANTGMAMIVVDANHHVYALTFSTSQRAIAGANASLNGKWVIEPLSEVPSLANFGLTSQEAAFEQAYVTAATK